MRCYPLDAGGAAEGEPLADGPLVLRDLSAQARFGLKGRGSADWLAAQGLTLPAVNRLQGGLLRLGRDDLLVIDNADALRAAWQAAPAPKGYNAWREETWAWMHLSGSRLDELMAKICPVDLSPRAFAEGQIAQTRVGYIEAITWRHTHAGVAGFAVLFDIAATAFFTCAVASAAEEFRP